MTGHRISKKHFKKDHLYLKYKCLSCDWLLKSAVQSAQCGHWFCQSCIQVLLETSNPVCPNCKESLKPDEDDSEGGPEYFPDKFVRRDIDALELFCIHKESGCAWEGTFGKLEAHLTECAYAICGVCNLRMFTDPEYHNCSSAIPKGKLEGGDYTCPLAQLGCTTGTVGSEEALQIHIKQSGHEHSTVIAESIQRLESTLSDLKTVVAANRLAPTTDDAAVVVADGAGGPDSRLGGVLLLEKDNASSVRKSASPKGTQRLGESEQQLTAGLQAHIQEEAFTKMRREIDNIKRGVRANEDEIASLRAVVNKLEKSQRSKNAEFEDRDFRLSLIENSNHDGTMVWKIPQFNQRMSDARCGKYTSIFSLPFYTGRYGYKMCLRLYILGDGIGKGSYMSLFFVIMRGEFDSILQWPFSHKVTFKLINQGGGRDVIDVFQPDPMSSSFRRPKSDMNIASGCPRFVSHTELNSGGYIVDDTIFIKCAVEISTIRHP